MIDTDGPGAMASGGPRSGGRGPSRPAETGATPRGHGNNNMERERRGRKFCAGGELFAWEPISVNARRGADSCVARRDGGQRGPPYKLISFVTIYVCIFCNIRDVLYAYVLYVVYRPGFVTGCPCGPAWGPKTGIHLGVPLGVTIQEFSF